MAREYVLEHYRSRIKKALVKGKEMSMVELIENTGINRSTLMRYVERFEGEGIILARFESRKKFIKWKK